MTEAKQRVFRRRGIEKGDAAARAHGATDFVEKCRKVSEISEGESTGNAVDRSRRNGEVKRVALHQRGLGSGMAEHAERQVHTDRNKPLRFEVSTKVAGPGRQIENS